MMGFMRRVDRCSFPALGGPGIRVGFGRQRATNFDHGGGDDDDEGSGLVYMYVCMYVCIYRYFVSRQVRCGKE